MENTPFISIAQNDLLILRREGVAVDCTNHTKHILRGKNAVFYLEKVVHISISTQVVHTTYINHRASGTYTNHRASGTYINHRASGTYIKHRASGTYINQHASGTYHAYQSPRKWYIHQSPRRKLLIKQSSTTDKTVTYTTYLILL
jgi:hypothetical protein